MVILDLKSSCAKCKGTGRIPGLSSLGITQINPDSRCDACAGRGFVLTPLGEDLLNLLRPFIADMVEERIRRSLPPVARPTA